MQVPVETFDGPLQLVAPTLALLTGVPPMRLWFQSEDETRLVQVQRDWLACNWQGTPNGTAYPRYSANERFFAETWDSFSAFVDELGRGEVAARQCELTYVNHILPGDLWKRHGELGKVIRLVGDTDGVLPEAEDGQFAFRYRIRHDERDVGRLYVQGSPALRPEDRSPVIQLNMIARGAPLGEGREGMFTFFRLAHEWIVRGFAAVTTDDAQDVLWGRQPP